MYILFSLVFAAANVVVTVTIVWLTSRSTHAQSDEDSKCESVPLFVRLLVLDVFGTLFRLPTLIASRSLSALAFCGVPCLWYLTL